MRISSFSASSDIVGRRVRICWEFVPEGVETLAEIPPVRLRRKQRDFAFPTPAASDPYLVYDSNQFPPAPVPNLVTVTDLPGWEVKDGESRTLYEPVSVATATRGRLVEVLRRTTATVYDHTGSAVRQRVEIVDTGLYPGYLAANTVYYYQIFANTLPSENVETDAEPYRGTAMVTDSYRLNRNLYDSLPEIYRRHDVRTRPATAGSDTVPEQCTRFGQLRRFVDLFGISLDSLRGTAEGLRGLHDVDRVDARFLPLLAQWIAWDFSVGSDIAVQRNELKAAPRLFQLVGTLPGLRALVNQYTGWFTQVAEFAQNLALSNRPKQWNLFAIMPAAVGPAWFGVDDAGEALGFPAGNQTAIGSAGVAAKLTGLKAEPFALRAGMTFRLAIDGLLPAIVRFGAADFADITKATAAEVAGAIDRALANLHATAAAGRIVLTSDTVGTQSELEITPEQASLVSLENATAGRLSPVMDSLGRLRLFYEVWEKPTLPEVLAPTSGTTSTANPGNYVEREIRCKTFADGAWRDSQPVTGRDVTPQADPAAVALPDGSTYLAWVDRPQTAESHLRFAIGTSRPLIPARLPGRLREPFVLTGNSVLTVTGDWTGPDQFTVHAADFANLAKASATELVTAMNLQLTHTVAVREANGSIRMETKAGGTRARINVDLKNCTAARAIGFDARNSAGVPGSWDDVMDWTPFQDVMAVGAGRHAEPAVSNHAAGGLRLAWARHLAGRWRIHLAHWIDQVLAGTSNGLFLRAGGAAWSQIGGLPSNNVRGIAVDSDGSAWIATAAGVVVRRLDGTILPLAPALPSADVRSVKLASDGTAWFATAAGVSFRRPDGTLSNLSTLGGLPSNDVRSVALGDDGSVWMATAQGVAVRDATGTVRSFDASSGLPSVDVRDVALDCDGIVFAATAAGVAMAVNAGRFENLTPAGVLATNDIRALAVGRNRTVWAATAGGVVRRVGGTWATVSTSDGLPSNDVRTVSLASDGSAWVGTGAGLARVSADFTVAGATGSNAPLATAQSIHTGWSAALELSGAAPSNREPVFGLDQNNRVWLAWAALTAAGDPNECWTIHLRMYDPATRSWSAETALTQVPAGGRSSDRMPALQRIAGGMRVFFSSDRNGGFRLWSVDVALGGAVSALVEIKAETAAETAPAPVTVAGATWLLYRGDRNIPLAQVGSSHPARSIRAADNGTVRRYAGSVTVVPGDAARLATRRTFGDLLCYTPNRPAGGRLQDDELYTRGTVGLYVSRANRGSALTAQEASRLRALLQQFVPINLRAVVIVVAPPDAESVYPAGADIGESYNDVYPFAETVGAVSDQFAAAMPTVVVLQSNTPGNVSADPANPATLQRRTFFPPIQ